jgi:hypothetical protein
VDEVYKKYRENSKENVDRMSCEKIPKKRRKCHPSGRKVLGRPIKRRTACLVITAKDVSRPHTG